MDQLRVSAFRGDPDVDELHAFFQPEAQFEGDTKWTFGTSLKSAYVNTFEFMNHAPVVQLWRDEAGALQAVSRLSLGTGEWFHQALPKYRTNAVTAMLVAHADAAFALLTDRASWATVRYESKQSEIEHLEHLGYERCDRSEVYMTRKLDTAIAEPTCRADVRIVHLDETNPALMRERAMAQIDAFSDGTATPAEQAWITRSLPHQLSYGRPRNQPSVVAIDPDDTILAFADPFYDHAHQIAEFEPVGTRTSAQRTGCSKAVMARALSEMRGAGMHQAVVRTGVDNHAAIAAYESVGFTTTDHLIGMRRSRL